MSTSVSCAHAPAAHAASAAVELATDRVACDLGSVVVVARDRHIVAAQFDDQRDRMMRSLTARYGPVRLVPARDPFGISGRIAAYLSGDLRAIDDISVDPGGTSFQQAVWVALRRIPAGGTVTYAAMAQTIGRPTAVRAVGAANARNPIAIVIPCHRMIGSDGSLTGYGGGLARKRWLLAHEGAPGAAADAGPRGVGERSSSG